MSSPFEVVVPDIGDFEDVEVIEILVAVGDTVAVEQSLVTLESDKATMEIPSPRVGVVRELCVAIGARVSEGSALVRLDVEGADEQPEASAATASQQAPASQPAAAAATPAAAPAATTAAASTSPPAPSALPDADLEVDVAVLGAGPGGYTAAFRAADLGLRVALIERNATLGGVCLNVGCIPSKALLHVAEVIAEARELAAAGVSFGEPQIDLEKLRAHKDGVVGKLTSGLSGLAKRRKVEVLTGAGRFAGPNLLEVEEAGGARRVAFRHAVIAAGSESVELPGFPHDDPRVMDSTDALELAEVPRRLLVIGGGIIGLEMASVYHALGAKVTVVELLDTLMTGADPDLVKALRKLIDARYEQIYTGTKVTGIEPNETGLRVAFEGGDAPDEDQFDRVLVAVGRRPNGREIAAEAAGVQVDERGFIRVDAQQRTNVPHIFAIGDVVGDPMLAHKATHEGKTAAEVIAGHKVSFDAKTIPSVAYTDPEVAWMGLTETAAKSEGVAYEKASFPWAASGRALGIGRDEGLTKLLFEPGTHRLLGAGIVGPNAGELIAELVVALEMGADTEDLSLSIHPHPTLSETVAFAAELAEGTITDLYVRKRS